METMSTMDTLWWSVQELSIVSLFFYYSNLIVCILLAYRFLAIFVVDFISAFIDLLIMFLNPSYFNSRERLKFARQQVIEQSKFSFDRHRQNHFSDGVGD